MLTQYSISCYKLAYALQIEFHAHTMQAAVCFRKASPSHPLKIVVFRCHFTNRVE